MIDELCCKILLSVVVQILHYAKYAAKDLNNDAKEFSVQKSLT